MGLVSLIEDRENDFSQEIFISPVSRYSIIFGKILGETYVSLVQGAAILLFGLIIGVPMSGLQLIGLFLAFLVAGTWFFVRGEKNRYYPGRIIL